MAALVGVFVSCIGLTMKSAGACLLDARQCGGLGACLLTVTVYTFRL
jgi:hypothetical protein